MDGGQNSKVKNSPPTDRQHVRTEDIAIAALFSALGAVVPEIMKQKGPRWVACFSVGVCVGAFAVSTFNRINGEGRNDNA